MRLPNPHKYYNWRFLYTKVFLPTPSRTGGLITLKLPTNTGCQQCQHPVLSGKITKDIRTKPQQGTNNQ